MVSGLHKAVAFACLLFALWLMVTSPTPPARPIHPAIAPSVSAVPFEENP